MNVVHKVIKKYIHCQENRLKLVNSRGNEFIFSYSLIHPTHRAISHHKGPSHLIIEKLIFRIGHPPANLIYKWSKEDRNYENCL